MVTRAKSDQPDEALCWAIAIAAGSSCLDSHCRVLCLLDVRNGTLGNSLKWAFVNESPSIKHRRLLPVLL
jgi:hypothetical protein